MSILAQSGGPQEAARFSVVLEPHRSLSPRGFAIIMAFVAGISFAAGLAFFLIGAWPVFGFFGLDVALVYWAFKQSFAQAERHQTIDVTDHEVILRHYRRGEQTGEDRFVRRWLRVHLVEDLDRELIGPLLFRFRGTSTEVGGFLAPDDRKSLATALKAALATPHI